MGRMFSQVPCWVLANPFFWFLSAQTFDGSSLLVQGLCHLELVGNHLPADFECHHGSLPSGEFLCERGQLCGHCRSGLVESIQSFWLQLVDAEYGWKNVNTNWIG